MLHVGLVQATELRLVGDHQGDAVGASKAAQDVGTKLAVAHEHHVHGLLARVAADGEETWPLNAAARLQAADATVADTRRAP